MSWNRTENRIEKKHLRRRRRQVQSIIELKQQHDKYSNLHLHRQREVVSNEKTGHNKLVQIEIIKLMIMETKNK